MLEPAFLKIVSDYLTHILVFLGALGGSLKASISNTENRQFKIHWRVRALNILIGIFCGIAVAGHYSDNISPFLAGILSLTVASVSIVVLEDIILLAPRILEWWISNKLNVPHESLSHEDVATRYRNAKSSANKTTKSKVTKDTKVKESK